jgi:hypothetical protein
LLVVYSSSFITVAKWVVGASPTVFSTTEKIFFVAKKMLSGVKKIFGNRGRHTRSPIHKCAGAA